MTPLQRAQRVEELDADAPDGPWTFAASNDSTCSIDDGTSWKYGPLAARIENYGTARFIAETRTLAPALAADVVALTDLLRDAYPMFSHVPLLRDRAAAFGLPERKEQDDA